MARKYGLYINGQYVHPRVWDRVPNALEPNETLGEVGVFSKQLDDPEIWEACLEGAWQSFLQVRNEKFFPIEERLDFLKRLAQRFEDQKENIAQLILQEVGKPLLLARTEVSRAITTLQETIRSAPDLIGKKHAFDRFPEAFGNRLEGFWLREPRGPLLAITPFNFPLNLVMHKLAPAIAAGCPVILKPSNKACLVALCVADSCHAEGLPAGLLNVFNCDNSSTSALIQDERVRQISFTGSSKVGWELRSRTHKPFFLELGGSAPAYVDEDVDLNEVANTLAKSAFSFSGQSCISTQSVWIHNKIYDAFVPAFSSAMNNMACGLPSREDVLCGPVVTKEAYQRIENIRSSLRAQGGRCYESSSPLLESGSVNPMLFEKSGWKVLYQAPTLIEGLDPSSSFLREEVFAPMVALMKVSGIEDFIRWSNALEHRLQAAVFSKKIPLLQRAAHELDFGGVVLNESPSLRFDGMPYGGRSRAGFGCEGPRFAMEDYTERKSVLERVVF